MRKTIILNPGDRFSRWTVVGLDRGSGVKAYYRCRCDCGNEGIINCGELRRGKCKSCGCWRRERAAAIGHTTKVRYELTGKTFGCWTVLGRDPSSIGKETLYRCQCECGTISSVGSICLRRGLSRSCGCKRGEFVSNAPGKVVHGHAKRGRKTREYSIWRSMLNRCYNPEAINYIYYGARGIKVCARWASFGDFFADMGPIPAPLTIDRIDTDGDYEPGNCRLATPKEQTANRRVNRKTKTC